ATPSWSSPRPISKWGTTPAPRRFCWRWPRAAVTSRRKELANCWARSAECRRFRFPTTWQAVVLATEERRYLTNGLLLPGEALPDGVYSIAAAVEYNGRAFCGWKRQSHSPSVQAEVEAALSFVANQPIVLTCAGRTDTGVHATNQIVHFD